MSWASRRRSMYIGSVALVVLIVAVWFLFSVLYEAPTCFDGERNGDEAGVDCGGSCERVCGFQAVDPVVLWSRFFEVSPGRYNAAVLIENPNTNVQAGPTPYTLKLRDAQNILVAEIKDAMSIPVERMIPLFIPSIATGERVPVRSTFTFDRSPVWERATVARPNVTVSNALLTNAETVPRLDATVRNNDLKDISDIAVIAILSDANKNAVGVSRTIVSFLAPNQEENVVFTWVQPFAEPVVSIEVIPTFSLAP